MIIYEKKCLLITLIILILGGFIALITCNIKMENKSNADLVVSGHTHGGQLFPLNYVGPIVNSNDLVYGTKKIKNTSFIVTSGVSDWEIKFKTGCDSEYIMININ